MEINNKILVVAEILLAALAIIMLLCFFLFLDVRSTLAKIEARGIESCQMVECETTLLGNINCHTAPVPMLNMTGGFWSNTPEPVNRMT